MMPRRPRAPVLRSIAFLAIARSASSSKSMTAKGNSYNIAKLQAENQAKIELTGRLASRVATLSKVNTEIVNEGEYGERLEHQTTVESKIVGSSSLKNLVYIMELFRVLKSGETEVVLVLGYKQ